MRRLSLAVMLLLVAGRVQAQATGDQPTLTLGITGGWVDGAALWEVPNQPYLESGGFVTDTFDLSRSLNSGFTFGVTSSYFPSNHFGFTGEIALLGLGTSTNCTAKFSSGSAEATDLCTSLGQANTASTAVAMSVGGVYRIASREAVSPFISAKGGIQISEQSTVDLVGYYFDQANGQQVTVRIFDDPNKTRVEFYAQFGAGFSFSAGRGYRFRLEARDNYVRLPIPDGPSDPNTGAFTTKVIGKHLFSIVLGFDILLEKKRGRRY